MAGRSFIRQLKKIVGEQHVQAKVEDLIAYGVDASGIRSGLPDAVVHPASQEEVARLTEAAAGAGVPLVPRGAGTGLSGGSLAVRGGLTIAFDRLNRLEIDAPARSATVEPGVLNWDLRQAALAADLFYPPDPSSGKVCTLGGNVAENASGPRGLKYGATADYLLALSCVLSSGKTAEIGGPSRRNVTGYDLLHLLAGSEGTLAIITGITVRLLSRPAHRRAALYSFGSVLVAAEAAVAIGAGGALPSAIEIMDCTSLACARLPAAPRSPGEGAQLLIEVDGGREETAAALKEASTTCQAAGGLQVSQADSEEAVEDLWEVRRAVSAALGKTGRRKIGEDLSVPAVRVTEMVVRIQEIAAANGLTIAVFGHVGAGNLHPNILVDDRDPDEMRRAERAIRQLFEAAVALGGTLSGEHGIGAAKAPYLRLALDPGQIALMRGIKQVFDPAGILNPGKIFGD